MALKSRVGVLLVIVSLLAAPGALLAQTDNPLAVPPGRIIVGDETGLYAMEADGANKVYLVQNEEAGCWLRDGKWSPDGSQLLYTRICGGQDPTDWRSADRTATVYLYDVDRQTSEVLLENDGSYQDYAGGWSPDGRQIVLYSNRSTSAIYNLFLYSVGSRELTQLTQFDSSAGRVSFDPSGRYLLYNRYNTTQARWDIRALDLNNPTAEVEVAVGVTPNWSPDGRWIAFATEETDVTPTADVFVMPSDCIYENTVCDPATARNITYTPEITEREPLWSADQTQIIYLRNTSATPGIEMWDVYRQDIQTGQVVQLTTTSDVSERHTDWERTEGETPADVAALLPVVVQVTSATLNLRSGPTTSANTAGTPASNGTYLFAHGVNEAGDWYYITVPGDGTVAWVFAQYTQVVAGDAERLPVVTPE